MNSEYQAQNLEGIPLTELDMQMDLKAQFGLHTTYASLLTKA